MECEVKEFCKNCPSECWVCRADGNGDTLYYLKRGKNAPDHPILVEEKANRKQAKRDDKKKASQDRLQAALTNTFDERKDRLKIAKNREETTNKKLQKVAADQFARRAARSSDGNSGRVANDDDHVLFGGAIRFDTKSQSKKVHPVIELGDYDECRAKSIKHGSETFGMVIYNKNGRSFIVFDFDLDWPVIQKALNLAMIEMEN
jgi:hypothetical protein